MERRSFLSSAVAAVTSALAIPSASASDGEAEGDIIARSRDRRVRFQRRELYGKDTGIWKVENRHTADNIFEIVLPVRTVAHSYATSDRLFIELDETPERRRTVEWFLQSDMGRSRSIDRVTGDTRIIEYDADGGATRRV